MSDQTTFINGLVGGLIGGLASYFTTKIFLKQTKPEVKSKITESIPNISDILHIFYKNDYNIKTTIRMLKEFTNKNIQKVNSDNCFAICLNGYNFSKTFKTFNNDYYNNTSLDYSPEFTLAMEHTAYDLMMKFHASFVYIYSDKIILFFPEKINEEEQHIFKGDKNKLLTLTSSMASLYFSHYFLNYYYNMPFVNHDVATEIEMNIMFNSELIVFPESDYVFDYILSEINKCFKKSYNFKQHLLSKTYSKPQFKDQKKSYIYTNCYIDTIRYGTILKKEIYQKENLSNTKTNERKRVFRCNINMLYYNCDYLITAIGFRNFIVDKYINFETFKQDYNDLSIIHKHYISNMSRTLYINNYYSIDPNEIRYEMKFRGDVSNYKKWLDYREELIENCDFREDSQKLVNYITIEFIQWCKDNNIELIE
jgi:hypothetical protein